MIVILEDSMLVAEMLRQALAEYETMVFSTLSAFREADVSRETTCLVVDLHLPDSDNSIADLGDAGCPVVLVSGCSQSELDAMQFDIAPTVRVSKDVGVVGIVEAIRALVV